MRFCKFFLFCSIIFTVPSASFANFDFGPNCLNAYKSIFELKLNQARTLLAAEKKNKPNNSIVPLLENYIDYFYLLTSENKSDYDVLKNNKSARLDQISADTDRSSPYYLYAQAEINLQWALIRGRYGEYFNAALEIRKANNLLRENAKKFPGFLLNAKGIGLINAVLGSLPDGTLKSTLAAFGIKGNTPEGLNMLDKLAETISKSSYEPFYEEVVFYYTYVLADVAHSPSAYAKTMKFTERIADSSLLKTYLQAYVCTKNGHNDQAIEILKEKPEGASYASFPYLYYLEGTAHLNRIDLNAAVYFNRFLQLNKGVNYIKDTYMHLAWIYLLKGDKTNFNAYTAKTLNTGFTYHEKDKQAQNEASSPVSAVDLLKARLLFDGGYLTRALSMLEGKKTADYSTEKDRTEFNYRAARIYDDLGKDDLSLAYYQNAINYGKDLKYYFAANAALKMGKIYEDKKDFNRAKMAYNTAIKMNNHEYKNSIESQAKAGLKRLGG